MDRVCLDHLASTPLLPEALAAMEPYWRAHYGSPSSLHQEGLRARAALTRAREQFAALIGAGSPDEILFTSGGTEAVNLALKGVAYAAQRRGHHLVVGATEHPAVLQSIEFLEKQGFTSTRVAVDGEGRLDPDAVRSAVTDRTILIGTHLANHDIGTIQPVAAVAQIAAERGIACFVDATTSGGWLPIDVATLGVNLLALAPHRFYGPKGVGVLYRNRRARLDGILHGGAQENGRRAGTENVPAIVGAGVAAEVAARELEGRLAHTGRLQRRLWAGLEARVSCIQLNGPPPGPERIPTSLNLSTEFIEGEGQALLCDMNGFAVATGSSCAGKSLKVPPVLNAIGLDPGLAQANLIVSLGKDNTGAQIDRFIEIFAGKVVPRLRGMSPRWDEFQRGTIDSVIAPRSSGGKFSGRAAGPSGRSA